MHFFILGSHPSLSLAELQAVLGKTADLSRATENVVLFDGEVPADLQERLGGTIKIGKIVGEQKKLYPAGIAEVIVANATLPTEGKIYFGVSVYNGGDYPFTNELKKIAERIGLEAKKQFKETGRPVRFVTSREPELSSVIVIENSLVETGGEWVLIGTKQGVLIGKTESVQNYKAWSKRDYGRPAVDPKSGMLPPKLARIMVNLATSYKLQATSSTLLDPFCGSGTVLMEALLCGFKKVIGTDISAKAIADSEKNLAFLTNNKSYETNGADRTYKLLVSSAEDLSKRVSEPVDAIVTETYLGPPLKGNESPESIKTIIDELMEMYERSFKALAKMLKTDGMAVVAFPVFIKDKKPKFLPIKSMLVRSGFEVVAPLPASIPPIMRVATPNNGLLYRREDQHVGREILIFKKK